MEDILEQKNLCRGCLSTDRRAISVFHCKTMYEELTGIAIGPSDGLSQWLCYECLALLEKCIRFRNKISKSHFMLCQYALENVLFEKNTASPHLSRTKILCTVIPGTQAEKPKVPIDEPVITPVVRPVGIPLPVITKLESIAVKVETDEEEEITIEEWRKQDHESTSKSSIREPKHVEQTEQEEPEEHFTETIVRDTVSPAISEVESVHIKDEELHFDSEDAGSMDECCLEDSQNDITCKSHVSDQLDLDTKEIYSEPFNEEAQTEQDENAEDINKDTEESDYEDDVTTDTDTTANKDESDSEDDFSTDEDMAADKGGNDSEDDVTIAELRTKKHQNYSTSKSSIINPKHKKKASRGSILSGNIYEGLKAFQCDECNEYFSDWYLYEEHWPIHAKEYYKCNICMKNFREKSKYELHCGSHVKKSYKCDVCKKSFKYKSSLVVHVHSHTRKKQYQCDICKKCFHAKFFLRKHIHGHTYPYTCGICNMKFSTTRNLIVHKRTHKDDKPFKCDICMKSFLRKDSLKTHNMYKHNGVIPFKCDVCNKPAYRKGDLNRHMRSHISEKPRKRNTRKKIK